MNCPACEHAPKCRGKAVEWYERVAICVADEIPEKRAEEIACEEMREIVVDTIVT